MCKFFVEKYQIDLFLQSLHYKMNKESARKRFLNSQITNHKSQRAHGVWYGLKGYVRTFQFVQNPIGRLVHCEL